MRILLADDEKTLRITLADDLAGAGHDVEVAADGDEALRALAEGAFDCVLTDLRMPGASGMEVLRAARAQGIDVLVITGAGTVDSAVEAMKEGAYDYLQKPFLNEEVVLLLKRLAERRELTEEVGRLRRELAGQSGWDALVAGSPAMQGVIERARAAARSDAGVLIQGESGTGKEVLARAIHDEGPRAAGPFVPISCGVLAESLLEAELFGHEKGAFTGAGAARPGRFERAHGGTVFLDDIDDMPKATQVKLLRVLQEHEIERVGGGEPVPVDIRIIAASKEDLGRMVSAGEFREDLYYRLNIITLNLPPLRKRPEDIPHLVAGFIARHADGAEYVVPPQTMERVQSAPWPGNVRQLENAVLRAIALSPTGTGELAAEHLVCGDAAEAPARPVPTLAEATAAAQHEAIDSALAASGGNRTRAAELLDISRKHLWELMKKREG